MKTNLTARQVRERFNISDMTLWNWRHDEKMGFPKPMKIRGRNYFDRDEIEAFEAEMKNGSNCNNQAA